MKSNKGYKIKRYNNIYGKKFFNIRLSPLKAISVVGACAVLLFVGVYISNVVYDRINNPKDKDQIFNVADKENNSDNSATVDMGDKGTSYDVSKVLDVNTALNENLLDTFIASLDKTNVKEVLLMLKDNTGKLYYNTSNTNAITAKAIESNIDVSLISQKLHSKNIKLTVVLSAFKDYIVSDKIVSTSVMYKTGSYKWIDKALAENGKTWLDPSSPTAQSYIKFLVEEVCSLGADKVIINDFNYPVNVPGIESAVFVKGNNNLEKQQVLKSFAEVLNTTVTSKGKELYFNFPLEGIINGDVYRYGGSIVDFGIKNFYLNIDEAIKQQSVSIGSQTVVLNSDNSYEMKENILKYFNSVYLDSSIYLFTESKYMEKLAENFKNIKVFSIY